MKNEIVKGMPMEEYLHLDACSNSDLKAMARSPAYCLYKRNNPDTSTKAMQIGTAVHKMLLEPRDYDRDIGVLPRDFNGRTKVGKQLKEQMETSYGAVITYQDAMVVEAMGRAVNKNPAAVTVLEARGTVEGTITVQDPMTGVWCRARPDKWAWDQRTIVDVKKTRCESVSEFMRQAYNLGYFQQMSYYLACARWLCDAGVVNIEPPDIAAFLVVTDSAPHENSLVPVPAAVLRVETNKWRHLLDLYATCVEEDRWPGWNELESADMPDWMRTAYERQGVEL